MSRLSKYVKEKIVKVLVTALVVGTVAGNGAITVQAEEGNAEAAVESVSDGNAVAVQAAGDFDAPNLEDPFSFVIYTDEYVNNNHVESNGGNIAIGSLKASIDIKGGYSYIGDFADGKAAFKMYNSEGYAIIPQFNSDNSENKLVAKIGQGYDFYVGTRFFNTDNLLKAYKYQNDIRTQIADGLEKMRQASDTYYQSEDTDNDYQLVYNLTASQFNSNSSCVGNSCNDYTCKIIKAASEGKKVIINIIDTGDVFINEMNNNVTPGGTGFQPWATNITWNFGKASNVTTNAIFGNVLAPNATVSNNANIVGTVVCKTLAQGGEIHKPDDGAPVKTPDTPTTDTPTTDTPTPDTPTTDTPTTDTPTTDTPTTDTPTPDTPTTDTPTTDTPTPDTPTTDTPTIDTPTPTPEVTPSATPTATPDIPNDSDDSDDSDTPEDPGTPTTPVTPTFPGTPADGTPDTPQVLGARRRRVVSITDDPVALADRAVLGAKRDRAVLGASRRPQTGDDSVVWNLGLALSLTGLGAWLIIKRKQA